jgi:Tol biopolymer transport system component
MVAGAIRSDAVGSEPSHEDIWIYDMGRGALARLTFEGQNEFPVWTPDAKWVTYSSRRDGKSAIYRVAADRSGSPELLATAAGFRLGSDCTQLNTASSLFANVRMLTHGGSGAVSRCAGGLG